MLFLDANVFLYAIQRHEKYGEACSTILQDIQSGKLKAKSSILVLAEMIGALQKINRDLIQQKEEPINIPHAFDIVMNYPIDWLDIDTTLIRNALNYTKNIFGMDCIHRSTMDAYKINQIISADAGFDNVYGIQRIDPLEYKNKS
ncbi:MAG: type II toxin-antitoxin system VapC family toxin [archaeon]